MRELASATEVEEVCAENRLCTSRRPHYYLELGPVTAIPRTNVLVVPTDRSWATNDTTLPTAPADASVDMRVEYPGPSVEGFPNYLLFRYYLRRESDGSYVVVTRYLTGAP
jgi:hypothetical protein